MTGVLFPIGYPEYNGGAPVTELEVEMTAPDASKRLIHRGPETECIVNDLSPGQPYLFHVRAINKAGVSIVNAKFGVSVVKNKYKKLLYNFSGRSLVRGS